MQNKPKQKTKSDKISDIMDVFLEIETKVMKSISKFVWFFIIPLQIILFLIAFLELLSISTVFILLVILLFSYLFLFIFFGPDKKEKLMDEAYEKLEEII